MFIVYCFSAQVSTEAPKFKTVAADGVMVVVQPPGVGPALTWLNMGDRLRQRRGGHYGVRLGERWDGLISQYCLQTSSCDRSHFTFES